MQAQWFVDKSLLFIIKKEEFHTQKSNVYYMVFAFWYKECLYEQEKVVVRDVVGR